MSACFTDVVAQDERASRIRRMRPGDLGQAAGSEAPVGKLRGRVHRFGEAGVPLVVTYHPAYLLRSPQQKKAAWDDLQPAQRAVAGEEPA